MRRGAPLLTALVVGLLLAGVPATAQSQQAPPLAHLPGIAVGDHWDFVVSGDAEGTIRNSVAAVERKADRDGDAHDSFRVHAVSEVVVKQRRGPVEVPVEERLEVDKWVRTRDHGTVGIEGTVTVREQGQDATTKDVARFYTPPLVEHIYPFGEGSRWSVDTDVWTRHGGDDARTEASTFHVKILGYEAITVPAGEFMAWKMEVSFDFEGGRTVRWYADEACTTVREERYSKSASETEPESVLVLTDHHCSQVPTQDPTYDPAQVTLHAAPRGSGPGTTTPTFEEPEPRAAEGVGAGVWVALAVVIGVSVALIGYGRRNR